LFWNANNDYSKPNVAMPEMLAAKDKYVRGNELSTGAKPLTAQSTTATPAAAAK